MKLSGKQVFSLFLRQLKRIYNCNFIHIVFCIKIKFYTALPPSNPFRPTGNFLKVTMISSSLCGVRIGNNGKKCFRFFLSDLGSQKGHLFRSESFYNFGQSFLLLILLTSLQNNRNHIEIYSGILTQYLTIF